MATTYRARRISDDRLVALKVPKPRCLVDPSFVLRFMQEGNLGIRLRSRFAVQILEAGEEGGLPFLAMEFLQGMTLKDALAASGRIPENRALQIAHDVFSALEHAHAVGLVHRDLKPENIMLRVDKCLKVMDFGVAKVVDEIGLTTSNMFIGSPAYAAPEMIDSKTVDHRVDIYSAGMILFEMLQGFPPFTGTSAVAVLLKQRTEPLPDPGDLPTLMSRGVWNLIEALTAKKAGERLPDARSARLAIELLQRM